MNLQVIKIRIQYWIKKIILYGLYIGLALFLLAFGLLQVPPVQKSIAKYYTDQIGEISGFDISYQSVYVIWYDRVQVSGLIITDPENNVMVKAKKIAVNFRISSLLARNQINLDAVRLDSTVVNLTTIPDQGTGSILNVNLFINKVNSKAQGGTASKIVNIGEIVLSESGFIYNNTNRDSLKNRFDYNHFKLQLNDGHFQNFKVIGDTIQFKVNSLVAQDQATGFDVHQLTTFFRISQKSLEFVNLRLDAGTSHVQDTIRFTYGSQLDLADFNNKVNIEANLSSTVLEPKDLALFFPSSEKVKNVIKISGKFSGKVNHFSLTGMLIESGNSQFGGTLSMDGLPTIDETFITLKLNQATIDIEDLGFLFQDNVLTRLKPFGRFTLKGNFTGFVNDFVADGLLNGRLGQIRSNLNLKINEKNPDLSEYRGDLELVDFQLGAYFEDTTTFKTVSLKGNINGRGLTKQSADFRLEGTISHFGTRLYNYKNIVTNAQFSSQFFDGQLSIDDPNLKFTAQGSIDFRNKVDRVKIKATLDTAFFHRLGLSQNYLALSSQIDIDSKGLTLDSLFGKADFSDTRIAYQDEVLDIDFMQLLSRQIQEGRSLQLKSSLADIDLSGNYYYSTLFEDMVSFYTELYLTIKNDRPELARYYSQKVKSEQEYQVRFKIILHDISPLIDVVDLDLFPGKGTLLEGDFTNGPTSLFNVYSSIDSLYLGGKLFKQSNLEFSGSKLRDSTQILAMLTIHSKEQAIAPKFNTKDLLLEAIWNKDHIELGLDFDQKEKENSLRLKAAVDFLNDSTRLKILPSKIKALDKYWEVNQKNKILVKGKEWTVHALEIINASQSIQLSGNISADPEKSLFLSIENFNLDVLNAFSTEQFSGTLRGSAEGRDFYQNPYIQNDLNIKGLTVDDFLIGDVSGMNIWNQNERRFNINFFIDRLDKRIVKLTGYYEPSEENPLHIKAQLDKANLEIVEPLLKNIFSEMSGTVTGEYTILGSFSRPQITGEGNIIGGKLMIDYLKTLYSFTGTLGMSPSQIQFKNFEIKDIFNNAATLRGHIAHKNFRGFTLNLEGSFNNFQLLNTNSRDNALFYGQGYATGTLAITGLSSDIKIETTARTEKNTRIFIPMNSTESVEKKDFLNFVNFTDTTQATQVNEVKSMKTKSKGTAGFAIDINLDITPDAYVEIIFDIKTGDIIRGRGNGEIKLQLDTKGDFLMFGAVEFTQGAYNFTLYDIINKEFDIQPGSRISWYGNPYEGIMDIRATYRQMASLAPILSDQTIASDPQIRRKYPTEVKLKMDGPMLSPQIAFDIDAKELPDNVIVDVPGRPPVRLNFEFQAFKSRLDEQELKRQVFSLVILRRFSPPDAFSTSGTLYNSVSELLSNQLSYWLTQVDQNLEIDMDLGTLDQEAFNTFQLRLSYTFLNGRLRVTRDGTFSNQYRQTDNISSIAGDWTVDYLLTPDGRFKVKMYSRTNLNQLTNTLGTQNAVTTGISLLHTQNFNEIKEIWQSARKRNQNAAIDPLNPEALKENEEDR